MWQINGRFLLWRLMPFCLCLTFILLHLVPFHFLPHYRYSIQWTLIPIFYFAIYNPKCLSGWAVFILGFVSELLIQSPLGVTMFCFVLMFFVANFLRKYLLEMTFIPLWIIFAALLWTIEVVGYVLIYLLVSYPVAFFPVWVEFFILSLIYPFVMRLCARLDRKAREATL